MVSDLEQVHPAVPTLVQALPCQEAAATALAPDPGADPESSAVPGALGSPGWESLDATGQELELFEASQLAPVLGQEPTPYSITMEFAVMLVFLLYLRVRNYYRISYKIHFI